MVRSVFLGAVLATYVLLLTPLAQADPATPTLTTAASSLSVAVGQPISDTATVANGSTGTIMFALYGPNDPGCTGTPVSTSTVAAAVQAVSTAYTPTVAGTYHFIATYTDATTQAATTGVCTDPAETVVVGAASPALTTAASPSVAVGTAITATATLAGAYSPTGTITFNLYAVSDPTCTGQPVFSWVSSGAALAPSTVSGPYTPTLAGTYRFVASYSGDAANTPTASGCGQPGSTIAVTPATPTVTAAASPSVATGKTITDAAIVAGGFKPTGTVTFSVYGPTDSACVGKPFFTSTVPVAMPSVSGAYKPTAAGIYHFVATYNGDGANTPASSACSSPTAAVAICNAGSVARSLATSLVAALTKRPGAAFKADCGAEVRVILRAREIRPGFAGFPRGNGYTRMADSLTHSTKVGQVTFSIGSQGVALRKYAESIHKKLVVFAIVRVRLDHTTTSGEAVQVFNLS